MISQLFVCAILQQNTRICMYKQGGEQGMTEVSCLCCTSILACCWYLQQKLLADFVSAVSCIAWVAVNGASEQYTWHQSCGECGEKPLRGQEILVYGAVSRLLHLLGNNAKMCACCLLCKGQAASHWLILRHIAGPAMQSTGTCRRHVALWPRGGVVG